MAGNLDPGRGREVANYPTKEERMPKTRTLMQVAPDELRRAVKKMCEDLNFAGGSGTHSDLYEAGLRERERAIQAQQQISR